jgi:hypothetical protein
VEGGASEVGGLAERCSCAKCNGPSREGVLCADWADRTRRGCEGCSNNDSASN